MIINFCAYPPHYLLSSSAHKHLEGLIVQRLSAQTVVSGVFPYLSSDTGFGFLIALRFRHSFMPTADRLSSGDFDTPRSAWRFTWRKRRLSKQRVPFTRIRPELPSPEALAHFYTTATHPPPNVGRYNINNPEEEYEYTK